MEKKPQFPPGLSVQSDWFGSVSQAKLRVFLSNVEELESLYWMLSVSLDETIALRKRGDYERAFQVISITPTLSARFARQLKWLLGVLQEHVSQHDLTPSVMPLHIASLHWNRGQFSALKGSLLKQLHFPQQFQFLTKCRALEALVEHLSHDFCQAASALKETNSWNATERIWAAMDDKQYDLNTCLREAIVMLKCVLRVMPEEQLGIFENAVSARSAGANWENEVDTTQAKRLEPVATRSKGIGQILHRRR
jgi:hypothetical protein